MRHKTSLKFNADVYCLVCAFVNEKVSCMLFVGHVCARDQGRERGAVNE